MVRPKLSVEGDPAATLDNLTTQQGLARLGVVLEMGIVVTQALAAIWFYKLYRSVRPVAGVAVAAFGLVNAVAVMASATFLATAAAVANDHSLVAGGDPAAAVGLLYQLSTHAWGIGALFFGLWLIPMGLLVRRSGWMPKPISWFLIAGGIGYIAAAFATYLLPDLPALSELLPAPATIGEFWMIGYLLIRGIRPETSPTAPAGTRPVTAAATAAARA
jgi:hypothetical protein